MLRNTLYTLFRGIYLVWMSFWFFLGFFMIYPFVWIIIQHKPWHKYYYYLTKAWAILFYTLSFLPVKTVWRFKPEKGQAYIFCPNHFSYFDIPLLTLTMPSFFVFVGLHDLENIPLFGYMYRKIHITVNRGSLRNRYETYQRVKSALSEGKHVVIFPEGGIWTEDFPKLSPFKEGPFKAAIEMKVSLVPVTIPYNWRFVPNLDFKRLRWQPQKVIFHAPLEVENKTLEDVKNLKNQTYQLIDQELQGHFSPKRKS